MAVKEYTFSGLAKFAQVYRLNKYGNYSLELVAEKNVRAEIKATGTKCKVKEDKDGDLVYTFRAPPEAPPLVTDGNGTPMTALIGNGSKVRVLITVEDFESKEYGPQTRTKLVGLVVDELVPYEKKETEDKTELPV